MVNNVVCPTAVVVSYTITCFKHDVYYTMENDCPSKTFHYGCHRWDRRWLPSLNIWLCSRVFFVWFCIVLICIWIVVYSENSFDGLVWLPSTTKVARSNSVHGEVCSIQYYVIKFVSHLRQIGDFPRALRFPPAIKLIATSGYAPEFFFVWFCIVLICIWIVVYSENSFDGLVWLMVFNTTFNSHGILAPTV
jgi:cbb3-type cytochrome oxidase subunit 3